MKRWIVAGSILVVSILQFLNSQEPHRQPNSPASLWEKFAPPSAPERLQIPGTRVTLIPAPGMKSMPGATMLADPVKGIVVLVEPMSIADFDGSTRDLQSSAFQKAQRYSEVTFELRPAPWGKRAIFSLFGPDGNAVTHRRGILIADERGAAAVVAVVPEQIMRSNPEMGNAIDGMLETVALALEVLSHPHSFHITPPAGYQPIGAVGGQMQSFARDAHAALLVFRLEKAIPPSELMTKGSRITAATLQNDYDDLQLVAEERARNGQWEYYEREFAGTQKKFRNAVSGLFRLQTNSTGETYMLVAHTMPPMKSEVKTKFRDAFESITPVK